MQTNDAILSDACNYYFSILKQYIELPRRCLFTMRKVSRDIPF